MIDLLGRLRGGLDETRREELLERFDLDPTKKGRAYSKGNRQKVALVAALSSDVELLLLDEPTAGLDPLMENVFRSCIEDERRRGPDRPAVQPHPLRGRAPLRPRQHHQVGTHRRDRHARRAAPPHPDPHRGRADPPGPRDAQRAPGRPRPADHRPPPDPGRRRGRARRGPGHAVVGRRDLPAQRTAHPRGDLPAALRGGQRRLTGRSVPAPRGGVRRRGPTASRARETAGPGMAHLRRRPLLIPSPLHATASRTRARQGRAGGG